MAKAGQLSDDAIISFLNIGTNTSQNPDDPITESDIIVTIDQLQPFDLNPRRSKGDRYQSTYDSIESAGLKHPPAITRRRPSDKKYSIKDGGNTRLQILGELHSKYLKLAKETSDLDLKQQHLDKAESFFRVKCKFIPFHSDLDSLSGHMIENETRSDTKFIERALAVEIYKRLFREEAQEADPACEYQELSTRALAERISKSGWPVSFTQISRYNYAVTMLLDRIPTALWAGAGHSVANNIKSLYSAYDTLWQATEYGKANPNGITDFFYTILSEFDDEKLDFKGFTEELDDRLSRIVDIPAMTLRAEIMAIQGNSKNSVKNMPDALTQAQPLLPSKESQSSEDEDSSKFQANKIQETKEPLSTGESKTNRSKVSTPNTITAPGLIENSASDDIPALRKKLIDQLSYIETLSPGGLGITIFNEANDDHQPYIGKNIFYDVIDFYDADKCPKPVFKAADDDLRSAIWWQLFKFSASYTHDASDGYAYFLETAFSSALDAFKKVNPENSIIEVILYLEHQILLHPEILRACQELQTIQVKLFSLSKV